MIRLFLISLLAIGCAGWTPEIPKSKVGFRRPECYASLGANLRFEGIELREVRVGNCLVAFRREIEAR